MSRRHFLGMAAAVASISGCHGTQGISHKPADGKDTLGVPEPTEAQRRMKRTSRSAVGIIKVESYEENIFQAIKPHLKDLDLPQLKGKTVVLKPNMVEFRQDKPFITTNPAVLIAAAELADYLGAREIIVGEGPGHVRDTEMLLERTGLGAAIKKLSLPFVDLNLDELERIKPVDSFAGLKEFFLPKTICHADAVISVPKMKTHHWVGVTASMKNMFGTVPGRKYGWPKNFLHFHGIPNCILDLQHLIKPAMAIVDGVVAMEGDGPINGTSRKANIITVGTDLAAVDATCARAMNFPFDYLNYIRAAGEVVGNIDPSMIDIVGVPLDSVTQTFTRPPSFINTALLLGSGQGAS